MNILDKLPKETGVYHVMGPKLVTKGFWIFSKTVVVEKPILQIEVSRGRNFVFAKSADTREYLGVITKDDVDKSSKAYRAIENALFEMTKIKRLE